MVVYFLPECSICIVKQKLHSTIFFQGPEVIKKIVPVAEKTPKEISEIFENDPPVEMAPSDPCIDELFPPENITDPLAAEPR